MKRNRIFDFAFIIIAAITVWFMSQKPIYNWDMIEYMGVATEYTVHDQKAVHDTVYNALRNQVPDSIYAGLTKNIEERKDCLTNVKSFESEMGFFRTKPLYTFCVFALHKAGVPLVKSTILPSVFASFFLLLIIFYWLSTFLQKKWAFAFALLFMSLPIFNELDCYSTPDPLSNLFVLLSLFLLANNRSKLSIIGTALISVVARIDNFILAIVEVYFLYFRKTKNILLKLFLLGIFSIAAVIGIPMMLGDNANWFTKFAFLFSIHNYIQHWRDVIYLVRTNGFYLLLIGMWAWMFFKASKEMRAILYTIFITIAIRLILFPSMQERFFAAYEFATLILFIKYLFIHYRAITITKHFRKAE